MNKYLIRGISLSLSFLLLANSTGGCIGAPIAHSPTKITHVRIYTEALAADVQFVHHPLMTAEIRNEIVQFIRNIPFEELKILFMRSEAPDMDFWVWRASRRFVDKYSKPLIPLVNHEFYRQADIRAILADESLLLKRILLLDRNGKAAREEFTYFAEILTAALDTLSADRTVKQERLLEELAVLLVKWWSDNRQPTNAIIRRVWPLDRLPPVWLPSLLDILVNTFTEFDSIVRYVVGDSPELLAASSQLRNDSEELLVPTAVKHIGSALTRLLNVAAHAPIPTSLRWTEEFILRLCGRVGTAHVVRYLLERIRVLNYLTERKTADHTDTRLDENSPIPPMRSFPYVMSMDEMIMWLENIIVQITKLNPAQKKTIIDILRRHETKIPQARLWRRLQPDDSILKYDQGSQIVEFTVILTGVVVAGILLHGHTLMAVLGMIGMIAFAHAGGTKAARHPQSESPDLMQHLFERIYRLVEGHITLTRKKTSSPETDHEIIWLSAEAGLSFQIEVLLSDPSYQQPVKTEPRFGYLARELGAYAQRVMARNIKEGRQIWIETLEEAREAVKSSGLREEQKVKVIAHLNVEIFKLNQLPPKKVSGRRLAYRAA